jgi:protein phosphatase
VLLIGSSGSGKSTFAKNHFKRTEIVSSDFCRGLVSDDENDQSVSEHAFDLLHYIVSKRLLIGRLTVVDATNVREAARKELIKIARSYGCLPVAIVFNIPEEVCRQRDRRRNDRQVGGSIIKKHVQLLAKSFYNLPNEGFKYIYVLNSQEEINQAEIEREG